MKARRSAHRAGLGNSGAELLLQFFEDALEGVVIDVPEPNDVADHHEIRRDLRALAGLQLRRQCRAGRFEQHGGERTFFFVDAHAGQQLVAFDLAQRGHKRVGVAQRNNDGVLDDVGLILHALAEAEHLGERPRLGRQGLVGFERDIAVERCERRRAVARPRLAQSQVEPRGRIGGFLLRQ